MSNIALQLHSIAYRYAPANAKIIMDAAEEIQRLEALVKERDAKVKSLDTLYYVLKCTYEKNLTQISIANEQLAKFKDCVAVPVDSYNLVAKFMQCDLEHHLLSSNSEEIVKQFLKASEHNNG